jgi:hypothetical protein
VLISASSISSTLPTMFGERHVSAGRRNLIPKFKKPVLNRALSGITTGSLTHKTGRHSTAAAALPVFAGNHRWSVLQRQA